MKSRVLIAIATQQFIETDYLMTKFLVQDLFGSTRRKRTNTLFGEYNQSELTLV